MPILDDTRPWWKFWGGKESDLLGWKANAPCPDEVGTASGTHTCGQRGPHYQHTCADPECGFRWAR